MRDKENTELEDLSAKCHKNIGQLISDEHDLKLRITIMFT